LLLDLWYETPLGSFKAAFFKVGSAESQFSAYGCRDPRDEDA